MRKFVVGLGWSVMAWSGMAAADPLDQAPMSARPAELLAAARSVPASESDVTLLRDDFTVAYDDAGRTEQHSRLLVVITKQAGVDSWGQLRQSWSPFYQDRPVIRARVISPDGSVAELDQALLHDAPVVSESASVYSDRRMLDVPLPRLSVGAVIEEDVVVKDREPLLAAGSTNLVGLVRGVPVLHERVTISAPSSRPLHLLVRGLAKAPTPRKVTRAGRTTWTYDLDAVAAFDHDLVGVPPDVAPVPYLGTATGASWAAIASDYRRLVDDRLKGTIALPDGVKAATPRETIERAVAWLHAHVRYTGIELRDSAIIPFTPAETAARGFGDCKDKATLLVALLRAAGVDADLAVLSTGPGTDLDRELPGLGGFDHAIVRARLDGKDLWIDATAEGLPAGQLPAGDQGRLALVLAAGTRDLVTTPVAAPADNLEHRVRTYHLAEHDFGSVTEVTVQHGAFWDDLRLWFRDTKYSDASKSVASYVEHVFKGTLASVSGNHPTAVTQPFELTVEATDVDRAFTHRDHIDVYLYAHDTLAQIPPIFTDTGAQYEAAVKDRTIDYVWFVPQVSEIENRLVLPPGYTAPQLVAHEQQAIGTLTLTTDRRLDKDALVITYRLDSGKRRITAAELAADRAAVKAFDDAAAEHVIIAQTGSQLVEQGKIKEAIVEYQRLIALHPDEALHYDQLAGVYHLAGMGAAARRIARQGTVVEPTSGDAFAQLGFQLRADSLGRQHGYDMDRKAALDAYRKALALMPTHIGAMKDLATLLLIDDDGFVTSNARDRVEAVDVTRRLHDHGKLDADAVAYAEALLSAGKFADAEVVARALPESDDSASIRVFAAAGAHGAPDALALAGSLASGSAAKRLLDAVTGRCVQARRYDLARAFLAARLADDPDPERSEIMARMAAVDLDKLDPADPRTPVVLSIASMTGVPIVHPPWSPEVATVLTAATQQLVTGRAGRNLHAMSRQVAVDAIISYTELKVDSRDADGWRVRTETGDKHNVMYVVLDHGRARLIGSTLIQSGVGAHVLELLGRKDETGADRWMRRLSDDAAPTAALPPIERDALTIYRDALARAAGKSPSKDVVELVAALVTEDAAPATAAPILRRCAVSGDDVHDVCRARLLGVLEHLGQWAELAELARQIAAKATKPDVHAILVEIRALTRLGRFADAQAVATEALTRMPDEPALLIGRAKAFLAAGSWPDAARAFDAAAASPSTTIEALNGASWTHLYYDADATTARELGKRAERMAGAHLPPDLANTLAAIEAESDHPHQAWTYLQESLAPSERTPPADQDWYVLGRIAESYGLRDDAIAAYRRVKAPLHPFTPSSYDFAQRNLKRMGAAAAKP